MPHVTEPEPLSPGPRHRGPYTSLFVVALDPVVYFVSVLPAIAFLRKAWHPNPLLQAALVVGTLFLLVGSTAVTLVLARVLFAGRMRPGIFRTGEPAAGAWLRHRAIASFPQRALLGQALSGLTCLMPFLHRGLGARLGRGIRLGIGSTIADPTFTTIGSDSVVGDGAYITCHLIDRDTVTVLPVVAGDGVTIGANAFISPGATIGDGAVIAAGAVLAKNAIVGPREIWGGVPARKIGEVGADHRYEAP